MQKYKLSFEKLLLNKNKKAPVHVNMVLFMYIKVSYFTGGGGGIFPIILMAQRKPISLLHLF
jgi:hypothetical protein